ncbi:MAG: Asp23/Gls24 family envelope stress response protein [Clostridiales bacterium]|nr:Asp23/Gls24 family envelope stress response protein [Clostridiales bacterium]
MSLITKNAYGNISTSALAISKVASHAAMESYGIVEMAGKKEGGFQGSFEKKKGGKGIKITFSGTRIVVDAFVVIKYGVSITAIAESLKEAIKYKVETFTGMVVDTVNVNVVGVKL